MESVSDLSPSARSRSPQKHREHASDAVVLLGLRILSGLHPAQGGEGRLEARAFIRNKCSRILLPFLIIGFLWLLPIRFALNYPNYRNLPLWKVVLKECLWGSDNGHLWFLPTLFLMFMLTLVLITICGTGARLDIVMAVIGVIALGLYGTARQTVSWNTYLLQIGRAHV